MSVMRGLAREHAEMALLALLVAGLALKFGGYHPRVWVWAALALCVGAALQLARGHMPALRSPAGAVLAAAAALTAWSAASISWAEFSRHLAWDETNRTLMYGAALALGAGLLHSSDRLARCATWLAAAIGALGLATAVRMAFDTDPARLFVAGRLDWPLGYSNAVAAFYVIGAWLLIGRSIESDARQLAVRAPLQAGRVDHQLVERGMLTVAGRPVPGLALDAAISGLCLGGACMLTALAFMAQSRGATVAAVLSLAVGFVAIEARASLLARLAVIGAIIAAAATTLGSTFERLEAWRTAAQSEATVSTPTVAALTRAEQAIGDAGVVTLVAALAAGVVGATLPWLAIRLRGSGRLLRIPRLSPIALVVAVAVFVGAAGAALAATGSSPVGWARDQMKACVDPPVTKPGAERSASHFAEVGTNRCDFWRVALINAREHPVQGVGANNFQGSYVLERRSGEEPRQAHSLPLQMLGELGAIGFLLAAAIVFVVTRVSWAYVSQRKRRSNAVGAVLAAGAFWLLHSSIDWLWNMPAVTLPVALLAGGLLGCFSGGQRLTRSAAIPLGAGVVLIAAATLVPQGLADRGVRTARDPVVQAKRPADALQAATNAGRYDPTWADPQMQRALLLLKAGETQDAAAAAAAAVKREPRNWFIRFQAAQVLAKSNPALARKHLARAQKLNPRLR